MNMWLINVFTGSSTRTLRSPPRKAIWPVSRVWSWASLAEVDKFFQIVSCWVKGIQKEDQWLFPPLSLVDEEERGEKKGYLVSTPERKIAREKVSVQVCCVYARNLLCISMRTRKCSYVTQPVCTDKSLFLFRLGKGTSDIHRYLAVRGRSIVGIYLLLPPKQAKARMDDCIFIASSGPGSIKVILQCDERLLLSIEHSSMGLATRGRVWVGVGYGWKYLGKQSQRRSFPQSVDCTPTLCLFFSCNFLIMLAHRVQL